MARVKVTPLLRDNRCYPIRTLQVNAAIKQPSPSGRGVVDMAMGATGKVDRHLQRETCKEDIA